MILYNSALVLGTFSFLRSRPLRSTSVGGRDRSGVGRRGRGGRIPRQSGPPTRIYSPDGGIERTWSHPWVRLRHRIGCASSSNSCKGWTFGMHFNVISGPETTVGWFFERTEQNFTSNLASPCRISERQCSVKIDLLAFATHRSLTEVLKSLSRCKDGDASGRSWYFSWVKVASFHYHAARRGVHSDASVADWGHAVIADEIGYSRALWIRTLKSRGSSYLFPSRLWPRPRTHMVFCFGAFSWYADGGRATA